MTPAKTYWVTCPECGRVTGRWGRHAGTGSTPHIVLNEHASGPGDGVRCNRHARTLGQRVRESQRAIGSVR